MTINLFQTPEYRTIMVQHIAQTIGYLFEKNQDFSIACEVKHITFMPELPQDIKETFHDTVLFVLGGYTFESAGLDTDYLTFEAGFGEENFGSTVSVPILAIQQLFVGDNPIILNLAKPLSDIEKQKKPVSPKKSSMEALLNNPENKKLLKNKK
ncbi:MAG TPA: hypothetical protein ENK90_01405 [Epsilonproteobacteria bacterium]|nr:hypothetical protein [Campylobacterota bacterium]HHE05760.1 hypothetical protein [Campylobacterota bacterium]